MHFYLLLTFIMRLIVSVGITTSIFYEQSYAEELKAIIKGFCLESFKEEMVTIGKQINNETADFTCNCFLNRVNEGDSLKLARKTCKTEALNRFNL